MSIYEHPEVAQLMRRALAEDLAGHDDLTVAATVPEEAELKATWTAKEAGVLCGLPLLAAVCDIIAPGSVQVSEVRNDGETVEAGDVVLCRAKGSARTLLIAERTALNCCQRLSGVATVTAKFVAAVAGTSARILDTRKTTPGCADWKNTQW